ncbi:MAG: aminotransferase class V-fold PLP-dependent enzyme, partial [Ellagibacter isourolithinifaciens]|nr:aminotransferase class V-fold PLP-dependent enzyme [Ellagibacter isourolithinifaciens]
MDVERVREDFPILGQQVHGHPLVYLDNSATTQVPEQVLSTVAEHYRTSNANVHRGMHYLAHASTDALEHARETVARFVGAADSSCMVFTRGTTDGLNMVARGLAHVLGPDDAVVVSLMEHHSNYVPWQQACFATGADFRVAGLTAEGDLDEAHYAELLADGKVKIVAMTGCSNVLGTVTPVKRLAKMAHDAGALFVLDGAQIMRHGVVDIADLGVDFLSFSGHKMIAGTGIGALCGTRDALEMLAPRDFGGEMV